MPTELPLFVTSDASHGYTRPLPVSQEFDLRVSFDILGGGRLRARMTGENEVVPPLSTGEHRADLEVQPKRVRAEAMRLRQLWKTIFVDYQPTVAGRPAVGRTLPCATKADLHGEPEDELYTLVSELADRGAYLLFNVLLGGGDRSVRRFRDYLTAALVGERLRIRFDSDLYLPWPMLCLKQEHLERSDDGNRDARAPLDGLFQRFLGYRHQIEHAGEAYPDLPLPVAEPGPPSASLNHDAVVGSAISAVAQVAAYLRTHTRHTVREDYWKLLEFLKTPTPDEQLMYFWCHGKVSGDGEGAQLVFQLSDGLPFDSSTVHQARADVGEDDRMSPFVLFNACYAGLAGADVDSTFMSHALIHHGAQGVLGPQIEMPQSFAAEYALAFLQRYIPGGEQATAGRIAHDLARHFADRYRTPLGVAYALHSGMNAHIPNNAGLEPDWPTDVTA